MTKPMVKTVTPSGADRYGSALLNHALERCDDEGKLAYLEASSPKSIPLYQRHGFELVGTIQVGSSPPLFPMLRKPRRLALPKGADGRLSNLVVTKPNSTPVLNALDNRREK